MACNCRSQKLVHWFETVRTLSAILKGLIRRRRADRVAAVIDELKTGMLG